MDVLIKYDPDQPREPAGSPEGGRWAGNSGVPGEPGTSSIPEGRVRRFHYTSKENADAIAQEGLKVSKSQGAKHGDPVAVWSNSENPFERSGIPDDKILVEFHADPKDWRHPTASTKDVSPKDIVAIHHRWHETYRYAKQENLTAKEVREAGYTEAADALDRDLAKFDPDQPRDPEGTPTGGQWKSQTDSPEFKAWFGDSKVVDQDGKPLKMYHGTIVFDDWGDFNVFDRKQTLARRGPNTDAVGSWFSDLSSDLHGAGMYAGHPHDDTRSAIYRVYLSIKNPWLPKSFDQFVEKVRTTAGQPKEPVKNKSGFRPAKGSVDPEPFREWLKSKGYDGVRFPKGEVDSPHQVVWIALEPTQIKSAIGNRGTFDPKSPDITKADNEFYFDRRVGKTYRRLSTGFDWQKDAKQVDRYAAAVYDWLQSTKQNLVKLIVGREALANRGNKLVKYDPDQPRDPAGSSTGGQWTSGFQPLDFTREDVLADSSFVYHATSLDRLHDIADARLLNVHNPDDFTDQSEWPDGGQEKRAYFAKSPAVARSFTPEGTPVLLRTPRSDLIRPERGTGDFYTAKPVETSRLEYLSTNGWKPVGSSMIKYDPDQPRDPAGSPTGGQWSSNPHVASYSSSYRGDITSHYDTRFFDVVNDDLADEKGEVIASKQALKAKRPTVEWIDDIAKPDPALMYRGMSHAEYESIKQSGKIESKGGYNIGDVQKDLTYYGTDQATASSYANSFAPNEHKPDFNKPAYVVGVRRPASDRIIKVPGTGDNEIGVRGSISASDIAEVYRGNVIAYTPAFKDRGFSSNASARVHWKRLDPLAKAEPTAEDLAEWARIAEELSRALTMGDVQLLVQEAQAIGGYVAQQTSRQVLARFGMADTSELFNAIDPDMIAFARERAAEMVGMRWEDDELRPSRNARKRIDTSTRDMVRRLIATYLAAGHTLEYIVKELEGMGDPAYPFSKQRAFVIASTEIANAASHGELATAKRMRDEENLIVTKSWAVADTPCPICDANHAQGEIDLDEPFQSGDMAPTAHPNAVFEGHSYISYGSTVQALRSRYDGPAISVEASFLDDPVKIASRYFSDLSDSFKGDVFSKHLEGFFQNLFGDHNLIVYKLAIGPNHPMLTDRGFIPARLLKKGDKLLYDLRLAGLSVTTNDKQIPLVENAFETLSASGRIVAAGAAATNFHGDEAFIYGEVDAVLPNLDLLPKLDSSFLQKLCKCRLTGAYTSPDHLASCGACQETFRAVFDAASGRVGGFGEFLSLFGGFGGPIVSESLDGFDASLLPLFGGEDGPFCFTTLTVGQTQKTSFHGWAFDASTTQSIYNIGGVVVKNCRCSLLTHAGFPGEQTLRLVDSMVDFHRAVLGDDLFGELIKYDPDQPRAPEGSDIGGQWVSGDAAILNSEGQKELFRPKDTYSATPEDEERQRLEDEAQEQRDEEERQKREQEEAEEREREEEEERERQEEEEEDSGPQDADEVLIDLIGMDVEELTDRIDDGTDLKAEYNGHRMYGDSTQIHWNLYDSDGSRVGQLDRTFHGSGLVEHDFFSLDEAYRGQGTGRQIMSNLFKVYEQGNVSEVYVHATLENGAYTWAKFGFIPNRSSWNNLKEDIIRPYFHEHQSFAGRETVEKVLGSSDPKALWELADSPAGKAILPGAEWAGSLDMSDPQSTGRFKRYIGLEKMAKAAIKPTGRMMTEDAILLDIIDSVDGDGELIKYDPDQPRDPKGTETGGQWSSEGDDFSNLKKMPSHIEGVPIIKKPLGPRTLAIGGSGGIAVNTSNKMAHIWKDMAAYQKRAFESGWSSSAHPNHTLWHELAHVKMKRSMSVDHESRLTNMRLEYLRGADTKVSKYAGTNGHEFISEVYAGRRAGRQFPPEIMKLYQELQGPEV